MKQLNLRHSLTKLIALSLVAFIPFVFALNVSSTTQPAWNNAAFARLTNEPHQVNEKEEQRRLCEQMLSDAEKAEARDPNEAIRLYLKAKELAKEHALTDLLVQLLYRIGRCYFDQNRFEEALNAYTEGRTLYKASFRSFSSIEPGFSKPGDYYIYILSELGTLYLHLSNYAEAKRVAEECLTTLRTFDDANRVFSKQTISHGTATSYYNLANTLAADGEYEKASEALRRAIETFSVLAEEDSRYWKEVADCYTDLGLFQKASGNPRGSLEWLTKARQTAEEFGNKDALCRALNCLGFLYVDQGDYSSAASYFRLSVTAAKELGDDIRAAIATTNLGYTSLRQGDHSRAKSYFDEALSRAPNSGANYVAVAAYEGLAAVAQAQGRTDLAVTIFDRALEFSAARGDKSRAAELLWWKGEVLFDRGDFKSALPLAEEAHRLSSELKLPNILRLALTLQGKLHIARSDYTAASEVLTGAIEIIEHLREKSAGDDPHRALFLQGKTEPYQLMFELLIAQNRKKEALAYAERAKARSLIDSMHTTRSNITHYMTDDERHKERALNELIVSLNSEIYSERLTASSHDPQLASLQDKLNKARLAYEALRNYVSSRQSSKQFFDFMKAEDIEKLPLTSSTAVLEFITTKRKTYLIAISRKPSQEILEIESFEIEIGEEELSDLVEKFRSRVANPHFPVNALSKQVYDLLLGPAHDFLKQKDTVIVVPDGVLWNLPFQALKAKDNRYFVEHSAISYAPSLNALSQILMKSTSPPDLGQQKPGGELLAFGNPASSPRAALGAWAKRSNSYSLPETEHQVKSIGQLYRARGSAILLGAAATEDAAKLQMGNYRILQFATHGVLDGSNPLYSHLVLSAGKESENDGLLEAREILEMRLHADLVVLSACDTARGKIGAGEGVIGLSWAFFMAGCPATVVSQWAVEARATTELMIDLHANMLPDRGRGTSGTGNVISKSEALRNAMLKLLSKRKTQHPFYWAGFVLVGDWR